MDEETLLRRKILDTANRSYQSNIYTYTNFLSISELSVYNAMKKDISFVKSCTFGGNDACERQVIQFGDEETLGYAGSFPLSLLEVLPLTPKFAESLNHRDYLGALMNLGIQRELIGDIIVNEKSAYIYCIDHISEYIRDNLTSVKHTNVKINICEDLSIGEFSRELTDIEVIAASPRIDAVVAALAKISRSQCNDLFTSKKIFLNGLCMENKSCQLKENDILVIRGLGKFIYKGCGNETRKGRVYIKLQKY
jgi:RNA-binding protein YlmH